MNPANNPNQVFRDTSFQIQRWVLVWNILSYLMVGAVTILALLDYRSSWPNWIIPAPLSWEIRAICLLGSGLWAGWYWIFVVRYDLWIQRENWKGFSFVFAILLGFGLSWLYPGYIYLLFGLFGVCFGVLRMRWAGPLVASLPVFLIIRTLYGQPLSFNALWFIGGMVLYGFIAVLLGLWINAVVQSNHERQRMIEQLKSAQNELAQQERQAGMLAERQRLAAAIHDTLAQDFTSIVVHLEATEQAEPGLPEPARMHLDQARRAAREGLAEARRFVWALQPEVAEREPLARALGRVVEHWQEECGVRASFVVTGEARALPPPLEVTLLRAAQEGLANVYKHSGAGRVDLTLTYMEDEVSLDVQDDGRGFDSQTALQPSPERGGYGLFSLRERARELGGSLQVESETGLGTTLVIQLPVQTVDQTDNLAGS